MGRPTKEEQEAKLKLQEQQKSETETLPSAGVDGTAGKPETNTVAGELEKKDAATAAAADQPNVQQGNQSNSQFDFDSREFETGGIQDKGIGELQGATGTDGVSDKINEIQPLKFEDDKIIIFGHEFPESMREQLFKDGVLGGSDQGDHVIFNQLELEDYIHQAKKDEENLTALAIETKIMAPAPLVTETELNEIKHSREAGIEVGDTYPEADKKYTDYLKANPHLYDVDHPDYVAKEDPKPVYHGDFLSEWQIAAGVQTTHNWDEVTAEEHEEYRPK